MIRKISSPTKQKLLLALEAGLAMGLTRSVRKQIYILKSIPRKFRQVDRNYLWRIISEFHRDRLVDYRENEDGTVIMILSEHGQKQTLKFKLDELEIKTPARWDKKWRLVIFDIPEKIKRAREALRDKLKNLGFFELQHSVWVFPYQCREEINFIVEVFEIRRYVRVVEADYITNEADLLLHFGLKK